MSLSQRYFLVCAVALVGLASLMFSAPDSRAEEPFVVEECGETVPPGKTAYLVKDLDCRGGGTEGIVLSDDARLVLGGHTILGNPEENGPDGRPLQGVRCIAGSVCTVTGPGSVVGFSASGIAGTRVRVRDVYVADNAIAGVSAFENVRLNGVALARNGGLGVRAGGHVRRAGTDVEDQPGAAFVEWRAPSLRPGHCPES